MLETDIATASENKLLASLRGWPNWVCYKLATDTTPADKEPRQVKEPSKRASINEPREWVSWEQAQEFVEANPGYGLGFVLTAKCGLTCIDLDATNDSTLLDRHRKIQTELFSDVYTEVSPSGNGLHLWMLGKAAEARKVSQLKIEVYSERRYMTVTFKAVNNVELINKQHSINELIDALDRVSGRANRASGVYPDVQPVQSDAAIVANAFAAKNRDKFWKLWLGEWQGLYPSQSEADQALANMLAYWTDSKQQVRTLFAKSELGKRTKAERTDYMDGIINLTFADKVPPLSEVTLDCIEREWRQLQAKQNNPRTRIINGIGDIPRLNEYGDVPTDYIIPGFLVGNAITLITGTYGGGKSTITSVFAEAISTGNEFLDRKCQQRDVLYLDRENPLGVVKNRFANFGLNQANPHFHYFGQYTATEVPQPNEPWIVEWAQSLDVPPVIVVDGFTAFLDGGNENDPAVTRAWFNSLKLLIKAGCAVVVFHHTGKGDSTKPFRGGTDIAASIDNGFMLESTYNEDGKFDELILTSFDKMRYQVDTRIEFKCVDGVFVSKTAANTTNIAERGQLYELLLKADGWSKNKFEAEAKELGMAQLKTRSFLNDALGQKAIRYDDGPRNAKIICLLSTGAK